MVYVIFFDDEVTLLKGSVVGPNLVSKRDWELLNMMINVVYSYECNDLIE